MNENRVHRIEHLQESSLFVEDLTCKHCIRVLLDELRSLDGVVAVRVSGTPPIDQPADEPGCGVATIKYNPDFVQLERIRRIIEGRGFRVIRDSMAS